MQFTCLGDRLIKRQRPPGGPGGREGRLVELGAGGGHVAVMVSFTEDDYRTIIGSLP